MPHGRVTLRPHESDIGRRLSSILPTGRLIWPYRAAMRRTLGLVLAAGLVGSACGASDDPRARLRIACDSVTEAVAADPRADSGETLGDVLAKVAQIAEETADDVTDTHELAEALAWELEAGGSVSEVAFRTGPVCDQVYDYVEES